MSFELITLRFYQGGVHNKGEGKIEGTKREKICWWKIIEFLDADVDRLYYFELTNYVKN